MNKEKLINPKTGKSTKCWSLDVPGLLANGWKRVGEKPATEEKIIETKGKKKG